MCKSVGRRSGSTDFQPPNVNAVSTTNGYHDEDSPQGSGADEHNMDSIDLFQGVIELEVKIVNTPNFNKYSKDWIETFLVNRTTVEAKIDTGAQANVMAQNLFNKHFNNIPIQKNNVRLKAYNGSVIPSIGHASLSCKFNYSDIDIDFMIVPIDVSTVIGLETATDLGLVHPSRTRTYDNKTCSSDITSCNNANKTSYVDKQESMRDSKSSAVNRQHGCIVNSSENDVRGCAESKVNSASEVNVSESRGWSASTVKSASEVKASERVNSEQTANNRVFSEFKDVFDNTTVGRIKDYEYDIKTRDDIIPSIDATRTVSYAIEKQTKEELQRMEKLGIITPVKGPTDWVSSMVVVQSNQKIRICLDPSKLNKAVLREHTHLPTVEELLAKIHDAKYFSKLDLKDGYWQIQITEESSYLTTFNTPMGRYRYTRLPFGLNSAGDVFQNQMNRKFNGCEGTSVLHDDILIHAKTEKEHDRILKEVLEICRNSGIKLNQKKAEIKVKSVKFLGHIISDEGIRPDPEKVNDVLNMPPPTCKKEAQSLLGTINFLGKFIPNLSEITTPIRQLLNKYTRFVWTHEHVKAFEEIKQILTSPPVLGFYHPDKHTTLETDASKGGLGAVLLQEGKPIAYGSRSLTKLEVHYSQLEKETLAITFGCERFHQYLFAKKIKVNTDHKPLIDIFKRPLHESPARILRMRLRLLRYDLDLFFVPGNRLHMPDLLSRSYVTHDMTTDDQLELERDAELSVSNIIRHVKCSGEAKKRIMQYTSNDKCLQQVAKYIKSGWPENYVKCLIDAKIYWAERDYLSMQEGLILFHDRIVVPMALRDSILQRLHEGHQGQTRCKMLARKAVYWRGINSDIERLVSACEKCLARRKLPPKEPMIPHEVPSRPWEKIGIDLFTCKGYRYQIVSDYFSKWVEVDRVQINAVSGDVIQKLKVIFGRFGIPDKVFSDGDPLYTSNEFDKFAKDYEFDHEFSSAGYPRSNGQVEANVKFIKDLLIKSGPSDFDLALLQYRNTPLSSKLDSPAMLFFNRNLRTRVPTVESCLLTSKDDENRNLLVNRKEGDKHYYDRKAKGERKGFFANDLVQYRNNLADKIWKSGQIIKPVNARSYEIVNAKGNIIRRNSCLLTADKSNLSLKAEPSDCVATSTNPTHVRNSLANTNLSHVNPTPTRAVPIPPPISDDYAQNTVTENSMPILRRSERIRLRNLPRQS